MQIQEIVPFIVVCAVILVVIGYLKVRDLTRPQPEGLSWTRGLFIGIIAAVTLRLFDSFQMKYNLQTEIPF